MQNSLLKIQFTKINGLEVGGRKHETENRRIKYDARLRGKEVFLLKAEE